MEENGRYGHNPKKKDGPLCQQSQGPIVRHHKHPTRTFNNRSAWSSICASYGPKSGANQTEV
eukprot:12903358-Prorocentrum_lima.AAC.1